jgi:FdhD protein
MSQNRLREGIRQVFVVAHEQNAFSSRVEDVVVEEPLEIRVAGEALALTMRTPGEDRFLAVGFLFAEGLIGSLADVGSVYACGRSDDPRYGHTIEVTPGPGARICNERLMRTRRSFVTSSACGVCGRDSIDDLLTRCTKQTAARPIARALVASAPTLLAQGQPQFARTGGLHAACAIDAEGKIIACAEDIGRHNAVDKVVGKLLYAGALPGPSKAANGPLLLAVSGRASFEIVQKAAMAGMTCVASISAPSSLAIETAEAMGITLAGFVRNGHFSLYTHAERVI